MNSKYYSDKQMEELFAKWLDEHFYVNFPDKPYKATRIDDFDLQKEGIDIIVNSSKCEYIIDEKATLHYINKNIPTFAFELLNRTSGNNGWLYNREYKTNYYLLCWPNAQTYNVSSKDDFTSSEVMLIKRDDLLNFLNSSGFSEVKLNELISFYLPKVNRNNYKFQIAPGISLFFTEWLAEKPVNIVIRKEILAKIAVFYSTIK